jgi:hypothetical protein
MSTITRKLDDFEAKLQAFIEGKLSRLSPFQDGHEGLSHKLVSSMREGIISSDDELLIAPDQFTILVHPSNKEFLGEDPAMLRGLADLVQTVGVGAGLHFRQHPVVTVTPNEDVPVERIDIIARISDNTLGHTANLSSTVIPTENPLPPNAFLIVNGVDVFILNQTVINIGRRSKNHLRIDDPRVSRQHAQIRAVHGRYEIFDLDSTGGTFINQKRVKHSLLQPGDVISLAGVHLIYGHDRPSTLVETKELVFSDHHNQKEL